MAAENQSKEDEDEQILYDLFVHAEWQQEAELLTGSSPEFWKQKGPLHRKIWKVAQGAMIGMLQAARNSLRLRTSFGCPPREYANIIDNHSPWDLALTRNGKFLAVLKNDSVEIRSSKDSFNSCIAKCQVGSDPFPQWRKLAWSKNGSFLCCSSSFGNIHVFEPTGSLLFTIKQYNPGINLQAGFSNCLCSLIFVDSPKDSEGEDHLVSVTYQGILRKFSLSTTGFKEEHSFSFSPFYPWGVVAVSYSAKHNVLVIAGFQGDEPTMDRDNMFGTDAGITLWRSLSDFPFYKIIENSKSLKRTSGKEMLRNIVNMGLRNNTLPNHGIFKICLSPCHEMLLTLHQNGSLALWKMPSLKLHRAWSASEQPDAESQGIEFNFSPASNNRKDQSTRRNIIGINWWSEKAIICSRGTGAITVASIENLDNLLGHSAEIFEAWPCTTDAWNGQFLVLECERAYHASGEKGHLKGKVVASDFFEKEDEAETFTGKLSEVFKQTMFFLTENDKFQPTARQIKYLQRTYRLVALKSTTPEELYLRKIDLEEYGEALDLAQRFKLDTDLVYQRQWIRKPMTVISIKDYLSKVKSRFWVLNECVQRVPEDLDALKHLLQYGLMGTNLNVILAIDTDSELPFVVKEAEDENEDEVEREQRAKKTSLLEVMAVEKMTSKQKKLCRYRWQILQYLDRLETYEIILGGPFRAAERFKSDFFIQFRCCNVIDQAVEYARSSASEPLEELFTYHGKDILPHWLAILSNFPETTEISSYRRLLPSISSNSTPVMNSWKELNHREPDWVEESAVFNYVINDTEDENPADFLYEEQPSLVEFRSCKDPNMLAKWYIQRAHEIEERSNLIDNALALVEFGMENGVEGLAEICSDLKLLGVLVYEVGIEPAISLAYFEGLSNIAKLKLLLSKSTEDSFINDYVRWGKPFLDSIGKSSPSKRWNLLHKFITDVAKADLTFPLKMFEMSVPGVSEPLIPDVAQLMKMAIESIYICKRDDQLNLAFGIVECLPTKEDDHLSGQIDELHKKVDELEELLRGAEILEFYNMQKTISFLGDSKSDPIIGRDILTTLARNASKREPALKPENWNGLLKHLNQLRNDVFDVISVAELHQIFAKNLLHSGIEDNLDLAKELLTCTSAKKKKIVDPTGTPTKRSKKPNARLTNASFIVSYDDSVTLVFEAAKEYFNAASNLMTTSMDLARKCLGLIEDRPPSIQSELDLIGALAILDDFDVKLLPIQVRLYEDKVELVRLAVQSSSGAYKKTAKVHRLAKLLQVSGSDEKERDGRVITVLAETALLHEDYPFAKDMCFSLMDLHYAPAWSICKSLCEIEKFADLSARQRLVAFALTHCHPNEIEPLLNTQNLIETQVVYTDLSLRLESNADPEPELEPDAGLGHDSEDKQNTDCVDGQGHSSLFGKTQHNFASTTKSILSSMGDKKWWQSKVEWVRHAEKTSAKDADEHSENRLTYKIHPFYASLYTDKSAQITLKKDFNRILNLSDEDNCCLDINQLLLRSQKLSESRAEGLISEPSSEVLIQLAESEVQKETLLCLAYILAMQKVDAEEFFDRLCGEPLVMQMAAYFFSLQILGLNSPNPSCEMARFYFNNPNGLILDAVQSTQGEAKENVTILKDALRKYLLKLSDFMQAKTLEDLGKGVDVGRFMQDDEYKKETVLGLAMNLEEDLLKTALSLAEKYDVEIWEVLSANIEFLFADSGLKAKEIQDRLGKLDALSTLQAHGAEFLERMKLYVYPYIGGKDHVMLLLLFTYVQQCCGDEAKMEGLLDMASHTRLLKKIKAAAPGMDYKALVNGDNPIEAIRPVLMESNVHLLAKLVAKIPYKETQNSIASSDIFLLYIQQAFWQESKKTEESQSKWLHRFESCQKFFSKLTVKDVISFVDETTFSENAIDMLSQDSRLSIVNRALKYIRKHKPQELSKSVTEQSSHVNECSADEGESHLEQSRLHIQSLQEDFFLQWSHSDSVIDQAFLRRYDLSRSDPVKILQQARDLFLDLRSPEEVKQFLDIVQKNVKERLLITDVLRDALTIMVEDIKQSKSSGDLENFESIIHIIKEHVENGGSLVTQDNVLEVVRPFCSDLEVETSVKMELLQLLEKSFELSGEDIFLLVYYQTDAIVSSAWGIKITAEEIDSDDKRYRLFLSLIADSGSLEQLRSIGQLLLAWPVLAAIELSENRPEENPWIILYEKLIATEHLSQFLEFVKQASKNATFGTECYLRLYEILMEKSFHLVALKMALLSGDEKCVDKAFADLQDIQFDRDCNDIETFKLILQTRTVARLTDVSLYPAFVRYLQSQSHNEAMFADVISQLRSAGHIAEAGSLLAERQRLHKSFSTVDNAISTLKNWFQR